MREIKFRAKHTKTGYWWYGSSEVSYLTRVHDQGQYAYALAEFWGFIRKGILDPKTVGQFIGITKNGEEVYEDDVLSPEKRLKEYGNQVIEYTAADNFAGFVTDGELSFDECEAVIGNIHDNPELKPD